MEHIDFRTSHNLVISYPRAELIHRILAFGIDMGLVSILVSISMSLVNLDLFQMIIWIPFVFFYHLLSEVFFLGQSIGKKVMKIRVVGLDGKTPSLKSYLIRWAFRLIDIAATSGMLAIASIYSSSLGQRIGDLLAGTTVVQTKLTSSLSLNSISKLDKMKNEVKFIGLTKYTDADMLLVKSMIQRYKENETIENENLINELAEKIKKDLNFIPLQQITNINFLESILKDYILATR